LASFNVKKHDESEDVEMDNPQDEEDPDFK
jgi:hypothetical protein